MKEKILYSCSECGSMTPKWMGQCSACKSWNSVVEVSSKDSRWLDAPDSTAVAVRLVDVPVKESMFRIKTGISEFDRVLGGGIVPGSVILVAGDPGVGKSTLVLQAINNISNNGTVLYVAGEESPAQIRIRSERLNIHSNKILIYPETNVDQLLRQADTCSPSVIVIDSIQTVQSSDSDSPVGTVSQVKTAAARLLQYAKRKNTAIIIIGHVTKEGNIAGPRLLEHMVDTVLYFEGDQALSYKILRATKNRFGSTNEVGIFEMAADGLKEITNPSGFFLEERMGSVPGSVVTTSLEGSRSILVELQALVTPTKFGIPKRGAIGMDLNRVSIILAVLEKRAGLQLQGCDLFVNIVGGIKVNEPSIDLALALAVASGYKNRRLEPGLVAIGEIGLGGEIRGVSQVDKRVAEVSRLFFKKCIVPKKNAEQLKSIDGPLEIIGVQHIREALEYV